ncbi:hypothetical protein V1274_001415 [Bradyrhizobium sp. AZCC 1614]|uniref:hypothetical protein n=1 Tax=unclassified Bradyrhizobium TaxID=2631580 RepID=UPI002FF078FA
MQNVLMRRHSGYLLERTQKMIGTHCSFAGKRVEPQPSIWLCIDTADDPGDPPLIVRAWSADRRDFVGRHHQNGAGKSGRDFLERCPVALIAGDFSIGE